MKLEGQSGVPRTLTLTSRRDSDTWARAVVTEGPGDTTITVTPIVRLEEVSHTAHPGPQVHIVMPPSPGVAAEARSIDHMPVGPGAR